MIFFFVFFINFDLKNYSDLHVLNSGLDNCIEIFKVTCLVYFSSFCTFMQYPLACFIYFCSNFINIY